MPFFFWVDVIALSIAVVITTSILLVALGAGLKRSLNRFFVLYMAVAVMWAVSNLLLRLSLWLEMGSPLFWTELAGLFFVAIGPLLLMFTVRYLSRSTRWPDIVAGLGLALIALLIVTPLLHQLAFNPHLNPRGTTIVEFTTWGLLAAGLALVYMLWSLALFWLERQRTKELYTVLSVFILAGGFVVGAVINIPVPVTSITYTLSFMILGYGVIGRQLFNPLRELTDQLQQEKIFSDTVINSLPGIFYVYDKQGTLVRWNNNFVKVTEYSVDELHQMNAADFVIDNEKDILTQKVQDVFNDDQFAIEVMLVSKSGQNIPYYLTGLRIVLGKNAYLIGVGLDLTERKQIEQERERLQQEVIQAQQQAIKELSTPVIPIMDRVIVMPLVGSIDTLRARDVTRSLLTGISQHQAKVVILDVTGVSVVDTGVVNYLNKTIQAARLKGARTIVTGISDAVAETIVELGIDWSNIETLRDLQTGLLAALRSMGVNLSEMAK